MNDPRLINVTQEITDKQKQYDDLAWDNGINDPRLTVLAQEIERLKKLEDDGILVDPVF